MALVDNGMASLTLHFVSHPTLRERQGEREASYSMTKAQSLPVHSIDGIEYEVEQTAA